MALARSPRRPLRALSRPQPKQIARCLARGARRYGCDRARLRQGAAGSGGSDSSSELLGSWEQSKVPSGAARIDSSALRRHVISETHGMNGGSHSSGGVPVEYQKDGLPRLPSHLDFHEHYKPGDHCPVCSLGEGERHQPGRLSHATCYVCNPPPRPLLRHIDEHGLALLRSLRRPKHAPDWWGPRYAALQARMAEVLESPATHYTVIGLTLVDLGVVVTELIISSIYPVVEEAPHAVHSAEEVLGWVSIGILSLFVAELLGKLAVFGLTYFTANKWHLMDAVVVVTSLSLELTLRGIAQEVASLLIFFRLWRLLRVMHGVAEAMELQKETEIEWHHALVHGLQKDLAAEHRRVVQLEREVAALSGAAAGAGIDVPTILRLAAAAASQPDLMLLQADAEAEAAEAAGALSVPAEPDVSQWEEV